MGVGADQGRGRAGVTDKLDVESLTRFELNHGSLPKMYIFSPPSLFLARVLLLHQLTNMSFVENVECRTSL